MSSREKFLLVVGMLFLGHSVAQQGEQGPTQCQPCRNTDDYIQCPGEQCPLYYQVTETNDDTSSAAVCQLPATSTAATTTSAVPATTGVTDEGENSTTGTTSEATVTTTVGAQEPNQSVTLESSNVTNTNNDTDTTAAPPPTISCRICLKNCRTCNGSEADDCLDCGKDHEFDKSDGQIKCVPKEAKDSGVGIAVIAGASAAGGVLLLVIVVVACVCCRRRRARKDQEQGPGMMIMDDILPPQPAEKGENADKVEDVQMRPTKPGMEVPEYVNVTSTMPRPISIERGHDKVLRYVRDPTMKKPEPAIPATEERELAELPTAPLPPPGARKRFTDAGNPQANRPPLRSHTTPPTETNKPDRWKRTGASASTASPGPSALPSSGSGLPKFPIEEEPETPTTTAAGRPSAGKATVPKAAATVEEAEEPEMDYENVGSRAKLGEPVGEGRRHGGGVHNPGLEVDEEPEDEYANQAAINEAMDIDENPYQNWPQPAVR